MGSEIQFKAYQQHQGELLPAFVGDALDPADPVFFVSDVVEGLDLASFERRYSGRGEHRFPYLACEQGRVAQGDCSPRAPSDPDVPN